MDCNLEIGKVTGVIFIAQESRIMSNKVRNRLRILNTAKENGISLEISERLIGFMKDDAPNYWAKIKKATQ